MFREILDLLAWLVVFGCFCVGAWSISLWFGEKSADLISPYTNRLLVWMYRRSQGRGCMCHPNFTGPGEGCPKTTVEILKRIDSSECPLHRDRPGEFGSGGGL